MICQRWVCLSLYLKVTVAVKREPSFQNWRHKKWIFPKVTKMLWCLNSALLTQILPRCPISCENVKPSKETLFGPSRLKITRREKQYLEEMERFYSEVKFTVKLCYCMCFRLILLFPYPQRSTGKCLSEPEEDISLSRCDRHRRLSQRGLFGAPFMFLRSRH